MSVENLSLTQQIFFLTTNPFHKNNMCQLVQDLIEVEPTHEKPDLIIAICTIIAIPIIVNDPGTLRTQQPFQIEY